MTELNYENLRKALDRLKEQYENFLSKDDRDLTDIDRDAITESVIQRFEFTFDAILKHIKKHLENELGLPKQPESPTALLRSAVENKIIDTESHKKWLKYKNARNDTSHNYDTQKAQKAFNEAVDFIQDAEEIYDRLTGEE